LILELLVIFLQVAPTATLRTKLRLHQPRNDRKIRGRLQFFPETPRSLIVVIRHQTAAVTGRALLAAHFLPASLLAYLDRYKLQMQFDCLRCGLKLHRMTRADKTLVCTRPRKSKSRFVLANHALPFKSANIAD
jgi:hypothetical protein